jgi:hypothetical protein
MVRSQSATRGRAPKLPAWLALGLFVSSALVINLALGVSGAGAQGGVFHCPTSKAPCTVHGNRLVPAATVIYGSRGDDRIWGGHGYDVIYGGAGRDRLHNFQAAGGEIYGSGDDICVIGVKPGGEINVTYTGCAKVIFKPSQGHG